VLLVITSWVAVTGICLIGCYLPNVLWGIFQIARENHSTVTYVVKGVVTATGLVSGVIAALTASSSQTPSQGDAQGKPTPPSVARILAIAGPLFVVCLIMVLSWGVKGLADYAAIERLLQSVAGVRRANIAAAEANSVAFDVTVRGGATGLDQGLAGSTRLVRTSAAGAAAVYRYQPPG